jgi:hypothetical protein
MTLRFPMLALAALLCAGVGVGCATTAPGSSPKSESSSAAIRAAEEVGATHTPDAALYLQLAKEQFEHARLLTDKKDEGRAERLRARAQIDAELALALARSESEKLEAQTAINKVKTLKETTVQ